MRVEQWVASRGADCPQLFETGRVAQRELHEQVLSFAIDLAKAVASLDALSGGRVDFGVGIGWLAEEFQALGMDFRVRARRCSPAT